MARTVTCLIVYRHARKVFNTIHRIHDWFSSCFIVLKLHWDYFIFSVPWKEKFHCLYYWYFSYTEITVLPIYSNDCKSIYTFIKYIMSFLKLRSLIILDEKLYNHKNLWVASTILRMINYITFFNIKVTYIAFATQLTSISLCRKIFNIL